MAAPYRLEKVNNETELLERVRKGGSDEFAELIKQYQALVFSILHRYERDAHLIEDLAQETFVKIWRALNQYDGRAPLSHWISRITANVALDHLRRRKRVQNETAIEDLGEDALEWLQNENEHSDLDANQAREILEIAMQKLSPEERLVITMQELEGKSLNEIAAVMGTSSVATRVRAFRARKKLKRALESMEQGKRSS